MLVAPSGTDMNSLAGGQEYPEGAGASVAADDSLDCHSFLNFNSNDPSASLTGAALTSTAALQQLGFQEQSGSQAWDASMSGTVQGGLKQSHFDAQSNVPSLLRAQRQLQQQHEQQQVQQHLSSSLPMTDSMQAFMDELTRSSSAFSSNPQPSAPGRSQPPAGNPGNPGNPGAPDANRDLLEQFVSQTHNPAGNSFPQDMSLEALMASGHVSPETLLTLINALKSMPTTDTATSANSGNPSPELSALAEALGAVAAGLAGAPGQPAGMPTIGPGGQSAGVFSLSHSEGSMGMNSMGASTGGIPMVHSGSLGSPGGASLASPASRQPSSLRMRRGLPDLPVHRPRDVIRAGGLPHSPLSASASPATGKRAANGLQMCWPLSPANKSPRQEGQMSPASQGVPPVLGAKSFPPSPTTALAGDLSNLAMQQASSLLSSMSGGAMPAGSPGSDSLLGVVKAEADSEARHRGIPGGDLGGAGGCEFNLDGSEGDEFGEGELAHGMEGGEDRGGGSSDGGGSWPAGGGGAGGRPKHSTKPRSVAERLRRERIAVRLQRLKDVMPKTDARIDTSAMLEDAVVYIRSLQARCRALEKQNEVLSSHVARLSQQNGNPGLRGLGI